MRENGVQALQEWRVSRGYSLEAAAIQIGSFRQTWHDWEIGRRIPDRDYMVALYVLTDGEVRPDHFYDLPDIGAPALQLDAGPAPLLDAAANSEAEQSGTQALEFAA